MSTHFLKYFLHSPDLPQKSFLLEGRETEKGGGRKGGEREREGGWERGERERRNMTIKGPQLAPMLCVTKSADHHYPF